jgi:putative ABC transport system ATP-binding protein
LDKQIQSELIRAEGLSKAFASPSGQVNVLDQVDLTVHAGEILSLTGPSGAGKSTLLQIIGLLSRPDQGSYQLCGQHTQNLRPGALNQLRSEHIGFVFQKHLLLPELSLFENVALPLAQRQGWNKKTEASAKEWLEKLELSHRLLARPHQLSGGEAQRGAIARALIHQPSLLLMDEPTGNLDPSLSTSVMEKVIDLCEKTSITCIFVTHNMILSEMAERRIHVTQHHLEEVS